jgi:hypothetical protein
MKWGKDKQLSTTQKAKKKIKVIKEFVYSRRNTMKYMN